MAVRILSEMYEVQKNKKNHKFISSEEICSTSAIATKANVVKVHMTSACFKSVLQNL